MKRAIPIIALASLLITVLFFSSCKRDKYEDFVPYVPINITKNINNPELVNLQSIGGWAYINGGSKGLILYRKTENEINCFDRHSTYLPENNCITKVDSNNINVLDPCSSSKWNLINGDPIGGEATRSLVSYETDFNGDRITISN